MIAMNRYGPLVRALAALTANPSEETALDFFSGCEHDLRDPDGAGYWSNYAHRTLTGMNDPAQRETIFEAMVNTLPGLAVAAIYLAKLRTDVNPDDATKADRFREGAMSVFIRFMGALEKESMLDYEDFKALVTGGAGHA